MTYRIELANGCDYLLTGSDKIIAFCNRRPTTYTVDDLRIGDYVSPSSIAMGLNEYTMTRIIAISEVRE